MRFKNKYFNKKQTSVNGLLFVHNTEILPNKLKQQPLCLVCCFNIINFISLK